MDKGLRSRGIQALQYAGGDGNDLVNSMRVVCLGCTSPIRMVTTPSWVAATLIQLMIRTSARLANIFLGETGTMLSPAGAPAVVMFTTTCSAKRARTL